MNETLGQRITRLRGERGMSQGDLADALDISRQSVSKWETDTSTPELDKLIRLAELFDLSMDALVLGKEEALKDQATTAEQQTKSEPPTSIKLGYQCQPISQTQKIVGLMLIGISVLFALICLVSYAWGGLLFAIILSSPLWGCGILCLTVRKRLGLSCCWLIFIVVSGYWYYTTGALWSALINRQFWIYADNVFMKITAVTETLLLIGLYIWTFVSFRSIRTPERLHFGMKKLIYMYIGCVVGYVIYFLLFDVILPHLLLRFISTDIGQGIRLVVSYVYHTYTFLVDALGLIWIAMLLVGARMLYNEYKAAKSKTA